MRPHHQRTWSPEFVDRSGEVLRAQGEIFRFQRGCRPVVTRLRSTSLNTSRLHRWVRRFVCSCVSLECCYRSSLLKPDESERRIANMNIRDIEQAGADVIALLRQYHNPPHKELLLDAILFAYLSGRHAKVARQHRLYLYGSSKPNRIDFRIGGSNPVVLELAPRSPSGGGSLSGSQNVKELRKLCRVKPTQAKLRALLLLDLADHPIKKAALRNTYVDVHAGPGKFKRSSVRVIYVHRKSSFSFSWKPFKSL